MSREWVTWFMGWPIDDINDWRERTLTGRWWTQEPSKIAKKQRYDVDYLKALGNGQVPLAAAIAWVVLSALIDDRHPTTVKEPNHENTIEHAKDFSARRQDQHDSHD